MELKRMYRGLCRDTGKWVYGSYHYIEGTSKMSMRNSTGWEKEDIYFDYHLILIPTLPHTAGWNIPDTFVPVEVDTKSIGQSTGLKDKNGLLIYEGDILRVCNGSINAMPWMDYPYVIKWQRNNFNVPSYCWNMQGEDIMDSSHWCEIIGNIYQNPELCPET